MTKEKRTSSIEKEILADMAAQYPNDSEEVRYRLYTNNFCCKLPSESGQDSEERMAEGRKEELKVMQARRKMSPVDHYVRGGKSRKDALAQALKEGHSERYATKTRIEFLRDVAEAIEVSKVNRGELDVVIERTWHGGRADFKAFKKLIWPVYLALREMGYTKRDLYIE